MLYSKSRVEWKLHGSQGPLRRARNAKSDEGENRISNVVNLASTTEHWALGSRLSGQAASSLDDTCTFENSEIN